MQKFKLYEKEVNNHIKHVQLTFERLLYVLFSETKWQELTEQEDGFAERISSHKSWIRTSELALDGITTEKMALIHLLWLQKVGRVILEDIDPLAGALLVRLDFSKFEEKGK